MGQNRTAMLSACRAPVPLLDRVHSVPMEKLSLREAESQVNLLLRGRARFEPGSLCPHDLCSFCRLIVLC